MNSDRDEAAANGGKSGRKAESAPQDLEQRLERLGSSIGRHLGKRDEDGRRRGLADNSGMAYGLKIGSEFVAAILVGAAIGWVLDRWLGTTPFGLIVFLILGFAAGVLNVMRTTGRISQPGAKKR